MANAMTFFARFSLMRLLLAGGAAILLTGMLAVATWVEREIESTVVQRAGALASLYMESFVAPRIQSLSAGDRLDEADHLALRKLFSDQNLGRHIVIFKLWSPAGRLLFDSSTAAHIGQQFEIKPALAAAWAGRVHSHVTDLTDPEHAPANERRAHMIETYAPVRTANAASILAVAEFYEPIDALDLAIRDARVRTRVMVGTATLTMFLLLAALVRRASNTIVSQDSELRARLSQLTLMFDQNALLHDRIQRAGARITALNERFLHGIAADIHDGPCQNLALAAMRMETLAERCTPCMADAGKDDAVGEEFRTLHCALQSSLKDLRAISRGLHLPDIEQLSPADTARRAVVDFERLVGRTVLFTVDELPAKAPLPVRITLFRLLQESLANGVRHGGGANQRVALSVTDGWLTVEIADEGGGFEPGATVSEDHTGLAGMRERVEVLGGTLSVQSTPGQGTTVRAALPLTLPEPEHA
jgi:signal transduction histidine kinase